MADEAANIGPPPPPYDPAHGHKGGQDPVPGPARMMGAQGADRPLRMAGTIAVWYENMQLILHPASFQPVAYESARHKNVKRTQPGGVKEVGGGRDEVGGGAKAQTVLNQAGLRFKPMLPFMPHVEGGLSLQQQPKDESNAELLRRAGEGPVRGQGVGARHTRLSMPGTGSRDGPRAGGQQQPDQHGAGRMSMPAAPDFLLPHLADQEALSAQHPAGAGAAGSFAWLEAHTAQPSAALQSAEKRQQQLGYSAAGGSSSGGGFLAFLGLGGQGGRQGRRRDNGCSLDAAVIEVGRAKRLKKPRPGSVHPAQAVVWSEGMTGGQSNRLGRVVGEVGGRGGGGGRGAAAIGTEVAEGMASMLEDEDACVSA